MKKVNIDAKETDKKNVEPLLEGELENAAGGTGAVYRTRVGLRGMRRARHMGLRTPFAGL